MKLTWMILLFCLKSTFATLVKYNQEESHCSEDKIFNKGYRIAGDKSFDRDGMIKSKHIQAKCRELQ